jgi:branched-chain amino acid transport system substrate-binding protein
MKKITWAVIVIVIILIIIAVSGGFRSSLDQASREPIKVAGLFALTGPTASLGEIQKNAATLAIAKVNEVGGINGRTVELILEDSAYDPKIAVNAYNSAKLKGARFYSADGSPVVSAVRKPIIDDGSFIIAPGATTPVYFDGNSRSCRIALTAKNFGPAFAEYLLKDGKMKVSYLLPNNEYGKGLAELFETAFTAKGGTIVGKEFYNAAPGVADYRTEIAKVKSTEKNVDAIVFIQVASTVEIMLQQFKELGLTKPLYTDYYTIQNPSLKNLAAANGIKFVDYDYSREMLPGDSEIARSFKEAYTKQFNQPPVFLAAANYDAMSLILAGIKAVGDDPQKVGDYISTLKDYPAVTGGLTFNSDCEVDRTYKFRKVTDAKIVD